MKVLKILGGIVGVLAALYLIACFVGPQKFDAGSSVEMDAPAYLVYNQITDLNTWKDWGPWMENDPNMKLNIGEKAKGVGAKYTWESASEGNGALEIIEAEPNKSMKTKIEFDGFDGFSYGQWNIEEKDGKSTVSWHMKSEDDIPFYLRGMFAMMNMSNMFTTGLDNIKKIVEPLAKEPKTYRGYTINVIDFPAKNFLAKRDKVSFDAVSQFYATNLGVLFAQVQKSGGEMDGMPYGLFYEWDEENAQTDMAAAIPVKAPINVEGYSTISTEASKALTIDYYGDYSGSADAHYGIDEYIKERNLPAAKLVMEEYVTDPTTEKDPAKWLTKITYLVDL